MCKSTNQEMYDKYREHMLLLLQSNSENYDKAILSLSSGFLAFSLAFIKDIVPLNKAVSLNILKISWELFVLSIILTIVSFIFSKYGAKKAIGYAEKYYLNNKNEYGTKTNWPSTINTCLNNISGLIFIGAIATTVIFVIKNI